MTFEDGYFEAENRCGFEVPALMKRVWAAQIELLEDIRQVCNRHDIRFFAGFGTLLGTVRHAGFIPWDDDLDICMLRSDLNRFLSVAQKELPSNCIVLNANLNDEYRDIMTRVVNVDSVTLDPGHMAKYHGCPFVIGIDIFPFDYIPANQGDMDVLINILNALDEVLKIIWGEVDDSIKIEAAKQVEVICGINLDWTTRIDRQVLRIYESLTSMYSAEEAEKIGSIPLMAQYNRSGFCADKDCFSEFIDLPFENTVMPVPVGYNSILSGIYGRDYMKAKIAYAHDYPFYSSQQDRIREFVNANPQFASIWEPYLG